MFKFSFVPGGFTATRLATILSKPPAPTANSPLQGSASQRSSNLTSAVSLTPSSKKSSAEPTVRTVTPPTVRRGLVGLFTAQLPSTPSTTGDQPSLIDSRKPSTKIRLGAHQTNVHSTRPDAPSSVTASTVTRNGNQAQQPFPLPTSVHANVSDPLILSLSTS
jgi:hypothetical protein